MSTFRSVSIDHERSLEAPPAAVWRGLTAEIAQWWPKDFYIGTYGGAEPLPVSLDPRPGGHFIEPWRGAEGSTDGLLWGTVLMARAPRELLLAGDSSAPWGGPHRAFTSFKLEAEDDGTKLAFSHAPFGVISDQTETSLREGWSGLLDLLVAWVDRGERPERPASVVAALE